MIGSLPEEFKIVDGLPPTVGAAAPLSTDYISLKNFLKVWVIIQYHQGDTDLTQFNLMQATAVAGTSAKAVTTAVPIWSNLDAEASDAFVQRTAAVNYAVDSTSKHKVIIFQVDPSTLDINNGFDCINVVTNGNVAATSYMSALFIGIPRYAGPVAENVSAITD